MTATLSPIVSISPSRPVYEDYKATRDKMPDDLAPQLDRIRELVEAFNIPVLAEEGYEADDIIGTIAVQAEAQGVDVRIITGDRDILQLLSPHVTVQLPKRGSADVVFDEAAFRDRYQLEPEQLIDLKALMGDSSDNIPGVYGVGEKGATKLLHQYETLDSIYEHLDDIKGSTGKKLREGRDMAFLSRDLVTIRRDLPVTLDLDACVAHDYDHERVAELFRDLEFRSLADRLYEIASEQGEDDPDVPVDPVIVRDEAALKQLVAVLNEAKAITWDVETTSTDQMAAKLVGIALAVDGRTGYYVPVGHRRAGQLPLFADDEADSKPVDQLPLETVIDALRAPLTNPGIAKYAHNAAYDLVVMQRYGIDVAPIDFDTMIAEWVIDPLSKFLGLKNLVRHRLGIQMTEIETLIGSGKNQTTMDLVDVEQAAPYAAADAALTHRLVGEIAAMERAGVRLDTDFLAAYSDRLQAMLDDYEREIHSHSGEAFNINSPKQLNQILFEKLNLPVAGLRKTTHGYSTDAATLESLKDEHPIVERILQYREVAKLKGTYVDALPLLVNERTGRVHTSYNQTGTSTGRLSSSSPNLQNIPIRTDMGREVRRAFIAEPGSVLLGVDYSQVELRVLAHISQDSTLLEAFRQNQDIHRATAAIVFDVALDDVTYEMRSFAKRINFGLIYGMGPYRLARESDLTLAEARAFVETYFDRLPGVEQYIEGTKKQAREQGYVSTLFGRRGEFPALKSGSTNSQTAQGMERAAINMPIQGTAADILKRAMIDLDAALAERDLAARMILQVHDELVLEVPQDELDETRALVVDIMENAYDLDAPLVANAQVGTNWRDMEDA